MPRKPARPTAAHRTPTRRDAADTQARLLDAAGRLFAAKGFEAANVREICRAARVNLAAVRHHFGSKAGLYRAVVVRSHQGLLERDPFPRFQPGEDPAAALGRAITHMLRIVLVRKAGHPFAGQLLFRELRNPTAALAELLETVMIPVRAEIGRIIGAILGDADSPPLRGQCTNFVTGLCAFHELGREALKRFGFPPPRTDAEVPVLAANITAFSLAGIRGLALAAGHSAR